MCLRAFVRFENEWRIMTGLGLVVCKRLLAGYGGELHIESQAGIGTEAIIQMPRHQEVLGLHA